MSDSLEWSLVLHQVLVEKNVKSLGKEIKLIKKN